MRLWASGCAAIFWAGWGLKALLFRQYNTLPTLLILFIMSVMLWLAFRLDDPNHRS